METLVRGTLRAMGFSQSWDLLVQLGMVRDDASLTWPEDISMVRLDAHTASFPRSVGQGKGVRSAVQTLTGAG